MKKLLSIFFSQIVFFAAAQPEIILAPFPDNNPKETIELKSICAQLTETAPAIDGKDTDKCWENAEKAKDFYSTNGLMIPALTPTEAKLLFDEKYLYGFFKCWEPEPRKLKANISERDGAVWTDDSIELFLSANPASGEYCHFIINSIGTVYDGKGKDHGNANSTGDSNIKKWNSSIRTACGNFNEGWTVEFKIPMNELSHDKTLSVWRVNFTRSRHAGKIQEWNSWNYMPDGFHQPRKFGILKMQKDAISVKHEFPDLIQVGPNYFGITLTNKSEQEMQLDATLLLKGEKEKFSSHQAFTLAPHITEHIELPCSISQKGDHILEITVADSVSRKTLYKSASIAAVPELIKSCVSGNIISSEENLIYNFTFNATPEFLKDVNINVQIFSVNAPTFPLL